LVLGANSAVPTGDVKVTGDGCRPGESIVLTVDGERTGSASADEKGHFEAKLDLPGSIGRHVVAAECNNQKLERTIDLVVSTSGGAGNGGAASAAGVFTFFVLLLLLLRRAPVTSAARGKNEDA
jgi:hypothetical protein